MNTDWIRLKLPKTLPWLVGAALFALPFFWFSNQSLLAGNETYTVLNGWRAFVNHLYIWNSNFGLGVPNVYITSTLYHACIFVFSTLFFSDSIGQKVMLGALIAGSFASFYNFAWSVFPRTSQKYLLLGSLAYVFNPFFVMMFSWLPSYGFLFMAFPQICKHFFRFINRQNVSIAYIILFSLVLSPTGQNLGLFGLPFIILSCIGIVMLIQSNTQRLHIVLRISTVFLAILLANAFWLLPVARVAKPLFGGADLYQANFQKESIYKQPILNSLTLNQYYWFDKADAQGDLYYEYSRWYKEPSIIIMLLLTCVAVAGIAVFFKKKQGMRTGVHFYILPIAVVYVAGVYLSKGTADPFGEPYYFLLKNITAFGIYRASDLKFPYLVMFALPLLLILALQTIQGHLRTASQYRILTTSLLTVIVFLGIPMITGQVFKENMRVQIPEYWKTTNEQMEKGSRSIGRILLLPRNSSPFDTYSWGYSGGWLSAQMLNHSSIGYTNGYGSSVQEKNFSSAKKMYELLEKEDASGFLAEAKNFNITHLVIRNDFDVVSNMRNELAYGGEFPVSASSMRSYLDTFMQRTLTNGQITVYALPNYANEVITSDVRVETERVNPTRYTVRLYNVTRDTELQFLESFDTRWRIYLSQNRKELTRRIDANADQDNSYIIGDEATFILNKPFATDSQKMIHRYANSWKIDADRIQTEYGSSYYDVNTDGTINIQLTLIYQPQLYGYAGMLITLIACLASIVCIGYTKYVNASRI